MAFVLPILASIGVGGGGAVAASSLGGALAAGGAATAGAAGISTLGLASAALGVVGTATSAIAASKAAGAQAQIAEQQARVAQDQASVKAGEVARDTRQRLAAGRAGAQQNGFELTGSVTDLLDQTARQGQLDYLTAAYDGSVQATGLNSSAKMYRQQGKNALISGAIGAAGQALGGVSSYYKNRGASISVSGT